MKSPSVVLYVSCGVNIVVIVSLFQGYLTVSMGYLKFVIFVRMVESIMSVLFFLHFYNCLHSVFIALSLCDAKTVAVFLVVNPNE